MIRSLIRNWLDIPDHFNASKQVKMLSVRQGNGLFKRFRGIIEDKLEPAQEDARLALNEVLTMQAKLDYLLDILGIEIAVDPHTMPPSIDVAYNKANMMKKTEEIVSASIDARSMLLLQRRMLTQQNRMMMKQIEIFDRAGL